MANALRTHIAACAARIRNAGSEIQLFPAGSFRARDGRPHGIPAWVIEAEAAARVIALAEQRRTPFVIDYEHQTLAAETSGQPAPAAGWFERLEWREGDGLYAVDVEWTGRARAMIEADEYRFLSPVFRYDQNTGEVRELLMAAVTNNPAIDGIADLAAARYLTTTIHEEASDVDEETLKLLGLAKDASKEQIQEAIEALRAKAAQTDDLQEALAAARAKTTIDEPDPAKYVPVETVRQLQEQVASLSSQVQGSEVDRLVGQGLEDGRLLPAMEDWARNLGKKDVAALRSYLDTAQPIAALTGQQSGGKPPEAEGKAKLSESELAVCKQLGMTEDEFLKSKEAN
jgi:phage I-like protein